MIREKLLRFLKKSFKILLLSPRITALVAIIFVFVLVSLFSAKETPQGSVKSAQIQAKTEQKITKSDVSIETSSTPIISAAPTSTLQENKTRISGEITAEKFTPSPTSVPVKSNPEQSAVSSFSNNSLDSGLLPSINTFRAANGIAPITSSESLCDIAGKRLNELIAIGSLDNHAGFNKYFQSQIEFKSMGEVLFQSSNPTPPDYAVNEGWAKSKDGHRENMLNSNWNYGCGATNSHIAVFNFGRK